MVAPLQPVSSSKEYQVTVFGASGFTGKLVCKYLNQQYKGQLKWAVAGRSEKKLNRMLDSLGLSDTDPARPAVVPADVTDTSSIDTMTSNTQVLINLVGPYALYGSGVVASCVASKTHYCDITAETQWVQTLIPKHHETAKQQGTSIVTFSGFDAMPSDITTWLAVRELKEKYGQEAGRVQVALSGISSLSGGTVASLGNMMTMTEKERNVMNMPYSLCPEGYVGADGTKPDPFIPFYIPKLNTHVAPTALNPGIIRLVRRTSYLLNYGPAFSYTEGFAMPNAIAARISVLIASVGYHLLRIPLLYYLFRKFMPKSGDGPNEQMQDSGFLQAQCVAQGAGEGGKQVIVEYRVDKADCGYKGTAMMLAEMGLTLLCKEAGVGGLGAGVVSPAVAGGAELVERLEGMPNARVSVSSEV